MNAQQARKLTNTTLRGEMLAPLIAHVYKRIELSAKSGQSSLCHPFQGYQPYPRLELQEALWNALRTDGYTVKHHPDPDPGHPASAPYDEVSW
jgi:hypothetical protein